ncbi:MAG: cardiolipin synthase [Lachnospiraceae bacterium]|nr:cardiolipin synthase [Lachnospiraceae bacterium]
MKRILSKLFSKLFFGMLIIALQFGWFVYMIYSATIVNSAINIVFQVIAVALALHVANRDIRTSYKMSWIFLILFLPVFGIPAYFIFGRSGLTKRTRERMGVVIDRIKSFRLEDEAVLKALEEEDFYAAQQSRYLTVNAGYPLYREDTTRYFSRVEDLYLQLLSDLRGAKKFIFMEYFIIEQGKMFDTILEILEEKAALGVDVRLIYDDVGCIQTLPPKFYLTLEAKGIHTVVFNPFRPFLSIIMNNRDHRKITVIDGQIAYTGGFNLADEYINEKMKYGRWKDAGIRMTGACVWNFTSMFLEMWDFINRTESDYEFYRSASIPEISSHTEDATAVHSADASESGGFIQPYSDSPLDHEDVGENVYLQLIEHAKKYVYIFTPYLIIGSEMKIALVNAAKCGVDVRIVVPGIPDKKLVYLLTQANFSHLIKGGVKIYKYEPGFIHSKCFVVDDVYATVGTVNLDYRSLYLHFECGTFQYKTRAVPQVKEDMLETFGVSHEVTLEECQNKFLLVRMFMGALKLFAPLL